MGQLQKVSNYFLNQSKAMLVIRNNYYLHIGKKSAEVTSSFYKI